MPLRSGIRAPDPNRPASSDRGGSACGIGSVGLAPGARDLRKELRARDTDRDRQPRLGAHPFAQARRDLGGRAGQAAQPAHLEEGLIDRQPFDERVVSRNIAKTARLAAVYASMRGGKITASGHSSRACRPPIAMRTPRAFAS